MYVPNSALTPFHDRSPWVMFPRSFQTLGYESTLICGAFTGARPAGLRILESFQVVKNPRKGGKARSLLEPLLVFGEIRRQRPDTVMVGPLRSSLFSFLPLVLLYRLFTERGRTRRTTFVLKADWGLDATGLSRLEAALSRTLLVVSTYVLDLVTFETSCGLGRARRLPGIRPDRTARVPLAFPQGTMERLPYSASPRTPVVLCVARITRMKGQDVLLKAFFRIAGRFPEWSIHLVGPVEDPGFQDELRGMAAQGGWTDRVVMSGFVEESELEREFSAASVFCLPSVHSENAGQVQYRGHRPRPARDHHGRGVCGRRRRDGVDRHPRRERRRPGEETRGPARGRRTTGGDGGPGPGPARNVPGPRPVPSLPCAPAGAGGRHLSLWHRPNTEPDRGARSAGSPSVSSWG